MVHGSRAHKFRSEASAPLHGHESCGRLPHEGLDFWSMLNIARRLEEGIEVRCQCCSSMDIGPVPVQN